MTTRHSRVRNSGRRPGPAVADVAGELRRLTPRDRWLCELLHEHQVLATEHVAALAFDTVHTARNRLNLLGHRHVLARFRDCVRPGSQAWRWTLGWVGASYIAARDGKPNPRLGSVADRINRLSASPRLAHLLGVNGLFVDLAAHARNSAHAALSVWWSERTCHAHTADLAHPDGHGVWTEHGRTIGFWLEYDTGSEPAHRVVAKLDGYTRLRRASGQPHAVLFHLQTARQEQSLHARLAAHPAVTGGELLVATASSERGGHPAGRIWRPAGHSGRLR
ncbi:MAG: replication-relaxation family protein, partial [Sporichthyaceae bacterium]|nr:replication-relaxation family protein [Sporichthyaceae bacterium]